MHSSSLCSLFYKVGWSTWPLLCRSLRLITETFTRAPDCHHGEKSGSFFSPFFVPFARISIFPSSSLPFLSVNASAGTSNFTLSCSKSRNQYTWSSTILSFSPSDLFLLSLSDPLNASLFCFFDFPESFWLCHRHEKEFPLKQCHDWPFLSFRLNELCSYFQKIRTAFERLTSGHKNSATFFFRDGTSRVYSPIKTSLQSTKS